LKKQVWHIYIIRCKDNSLYTGVTIDIKRRFDEHQNDPKKGAKYLKGKKPLSLVWHKKIGSKQKAMQLEWKIKQLPKHKKELIVQKKLSINKLFN